MISDQALLDKLATLEKLTLDIASPYLQVCRKYHHCENCDLIEFIENNSLPIIMFKNDGLVVYCNSAARNMGVHSGGNMTETMGEHYISIDFYLSQGHDIQGMSVTINDKNYHIFCQAAHDKEEPRGIWRSAKCLLVPTGKLANQIALSN